MKRMIASTIRPGATTAAASVICPLPRRIRTTGRRQHEQEGPEQLGEEAPPLQPRVVEVRAIAKLESEDVASARPQREARELLMCRCRH